MQDSVLLIAEKASPVFRKYGLAKVALFGSRARGASREDSDIDFLYISGKKMSMFDKASAEKELEDIFGVEVDLVADAAVVNRMRPSIKKDLRIIYEG